MTRSNGLSRVLSVLALAGVILPAPIAMALPVASHARDGAPDVSMQLATLKLEAFSQAVVLLGP